MTKVKYPIGAYAPGNYINTCSNCKDTFYGDKLAIQCEPCAINILSEQAAHWHEAYAKSEAENDKFRNLLIRVTVLEIETYPNRDKLLTDIDKALKTLEE